MSKSSQTIAVLIETGQKRVFVAALDWPGWTRSGKDEAQALDALFNYGPRYDRVLQSARLKFRAPKTSSQIEVVERVPGNATTDFGAPDGMSATDTAALDNATFKHLSAVLDACWVALQTAAQSAHGKILRTGPRGGGRDLAKMIQHVVESNAGYLRQINWRSAADMDGDSDSMLTNAQRATADALANAMTNGLPETGPRGGKLWPLRYFVRRAAWHVLDHAWEIEDRLS